MLDNKQKLLEIVGKIKNSSDFEISLNSIAVEDTFLELVSFDVKSMFTNIPF
jgi:hypothetical protein